MELTWMNRASSAPPLESSPSQLFSGVIPSLTATCLMKKFAVKSQVQVQQQEQDDSI